MLFLAFFSTVAVLVEGLDIGVSIVLCVVEVMAKELFLCGLAVDLASHVCQQDCYQYRHGLFLAALLALTVTTDCCNTCTHAVATANTHSVGFTRWFPIVANSLYRNTATINVGHSRLNGTREEYRRYCLTNKIV